MKPKLTSILLTALFLVGYISTAQDAEIFEHTWDFSEILDDDIFIQPYEGTMPQLTFNADNSSMELVYGSCESTYSCTLLFTGDSSFEIIEESISGNLGSCENGLADELMLGHFNFYGLQNGFPEESYTYFLTTNNEGSRVLRIESSQDNIAWYTSATLSLKNNVFTSLDVVYNKDEQQVNFNGLSKNVELLIFNPLGQKMIETSLLQGDSVTTSGLTKGVYLVQLIDKTGATIVKKLLIS